MIKLTYAHLNNGSFNQALVTLAQEKLPFQASYNISKILRRYSKELKNAQAEHMKFVMEYAELDEKGELKPGEGGLPYTIKEDVQEEYNKKVEDFMNVEVELDCHPISVSSLYDAKLRAADLEVLGDIITDDVVQLEE